MRTRGDYATDATYARSQFIALGAAVIVGRRGHNNSTVVPASTLTPPVLSLIGREWVVFPAKRIAIDLTSAAGVGGDGGGGTDDDDHHELITLSVSPTLGLVDAPRVAHVGSLATNEFCGWVGPAHSDDTQPRTQLLSVGSESGDHCGRGERFALVRERTRPGVSKLGVIDTARNVPKMSVSFCGLENKSHRGRKRVRVKRIKSVHVIKTACRVVVAVFVRPAALCADHYLRCLILVIVQIRLSPQSLQSR
ncbi:hypothetical protein Pelo_15292 [Pelomyxa schiedti]|nr:hypothetical protein Pelo_15292 [Pelomyxa schiedti]